MKIRWACLGVLVGLVTICRADLALGQRQEPAQIFDPVLEEVRNKTQIPILLPSKLPEEIFNVDAMRVPSGGASAEEYRFGIGVCYGEQPCQYWANVVSFSASRELLQDLPNVRDVTLANGIVAMFRPVSCGGSCAPANLWWEQNGVMYQIQLHFHYATAAEEQQTIMLELANAYVRVP